MFSLCPFQQLLIQMLTGMEKARLGQWWGGCR